MTVLTEHTYKAAYGKRSYTEYRFFGYFYIFYLICVRRILSFIGDFLIIKGIRNFRSGIFILFALSTYFFVDNFSFFLYFSL